MSNTLNRILAGTAAAVLLSGVGAMLWAEPAAAAIASPRVEVSASAPTPAQVPVHVPVNVCGTTANDATGPNPAFGNTCVND
jgi:ABC-type nitrate/sulfonate/bicarbonate transport system permease component